MGSTVGRLKNAHFEDREGHRAGTICGGTQETGFRRWRLGRCVTARVRRGSQSGGEEGRRTPAPQKDSGNAKY